MLEGATLRGVFVGPRPLFEGLSKTVAANGLEPVVDRVFEFHEVAAYRHMAQEVRHFSKLVIRI